MASCDRTVSSLSVKAGFVGTRSCTAELEAQAQAVMAWVGAEGGDGLLRAQSCHTNADTPNAAAKIRHTATQP